MAFTEALDLVVMTKKEQLPLILNCAPMLWPGEVIEAVSGNDPNGVALGFADAAAKILISGVAVNVDAVTVDGQVVAVGQGVFFTLRAPDAVVSTTYIVVATVRTSRPATRSRTIKVGIEG